MKIIVTWFNRKNLGGFKCLHCWKSIDNGVYIHPDNKSKTPLKSFCRDCFTYEIGNVKDAMKELFGDNELEMETRFEEDQKKKKK